jgi:hypothetical protein
MGCGPDSKPLNWISERIFTQDVVAVDNSFRASHLPGANNKVQRRAVSKKTCFSTGLN